MLLIEFITDDNGQAWKAAKYLPSKNKLLKVIIH